MMNIVTNDKDVPYAILIRAVEPIDGIDIILKRTRKQIFDSTLTRGPGNVGKALGIFKHHSGNYLLGNEIYLMDNKIKITGEEIGISKRIGVESAGEDAELPYRFDLRNNRFVS